MSVADARSIDSVRLKLVQLLDSITILQNQLHHYSLSTQEPSTANPGLPPWPDLLARFNLLLSHVVGLGALMTSVGDPKPPGQGGRDSKRERWEQSTVAPRETIEDSKDWLVGMLLRTKQTPVVESHLSDLIHSLPKQFTAPQTYASAIADRNALTAFAANKVDRAKDVDPDGEEYDWRLRVTSVDDDDDDEDEDEDGEGGAGGDKKGGLWGDDDSDGDAAMGEGGEAVKPATEGAATGTRKWTIQQTAAYARTGKLPE